MLGDINVHMLHKKTLNQNRSDTHTPSVVTESMLVPKQWNTISKTKQKKNCDYNNNGIER